MKDEQYMLEALKEAVKAYNNNEIPVGAVIVLNNKVIARGYNQKEIKKKATKHAEINAIEKACIKLNDWRLSNCILYVTLEPCMMCYGAILESRIKRVVYGTKRKKEHMFYIDDIVEIEPSVLEKECEDILLDFFKKIRNK